MLGLHFDLATWIHTLGYAGVLAVIFVQTGLLVGFFLPGDSLLFTVGFLASQHFFNIYLLTPLIILTAIVGYSIAYWLGNKIGHWLLQRPDSWWFKKRYVFDAKAFYEKHGGQALIIGWLIPVIRTFVPVVAGMAEMPFKRFMIYNCLGGIIWAGGITLLGYFLGTEIPGVEHYIVPSVLVIIIISILPGVFHFLKARRAEKK